MGRVANKVYALAMFLVVSVLCGVLTAGLAVPAAALLGGSAKIGADSLENLPASLTEVPQMERSRVLSGDGTTLAQFYEQDRTYVPLSKIAPVMQQAQVAIEDHRFFQHGAIDPTGTLRALVRNSTSGNTQGGSTLTQQYVKQMLIQAAEAKGDEEAKVAAQEQTVSRKVRELRYAIGVENKLTKQQVLERYLNIAYYGDGAYGVQAAAKHYFNTDASKLNLAQAAFLAGMVQNPTATNPRFFPVAAKDRRNVVLNRMWQLAQEGQLWGPAMTEAQYKSARIAPMPTNVQVTPNGCVSSKFPFICQYVVKTLLTLPALGRNQEERENTLKRGGLTIQTLINPKAQLAAEAAIHQVVAATDPVDSGTVIIRPKDGLIVAMAQNRTVMGTNVPAETYFNYSVTEKMGGVEGYQAGSTFKAFTIAAALAKGYTPNKRYKAVKTYVPYGQTFSNCSGSYVFREQAYKVTNSVSGYDDRDITMVQAAQGSVNTYFLQLFRDVGGCNVAKMATALGVERADGKPLESEVYPAFTLGTPFVTPLSMATAYATLANHGVKCTPRVVDWVKDKSGKKMNIPGPSCKQVIPAKVADGTTYVLQQVMQQPGTGVRARVEGYRNQAGKTGTTEANNAVWFAGYTAQMAGIAYIGINRNPKLGDLYWNKHRKSLKYWCPPSGLQCLQGSGSGDAGRIYKVAMKAVLQGGNYPDTPFTAPSDDVLNGKQVQIPPIDGMGAEEATQVLQQNGFSVLKDYQCSRFPAGTYLGYSYPRYPSKVSQDTPIYLAYSSGPCAPKTYAPTKPGGKATASSAPTQTNPTQAQATTNNGGKKTP